MESQILSIQKETIKNDHYDYLEIIYIYRLDTFFMVRHYSAGPGIVKHQKQKIRIVLSFWYLHIEVVKA